MMFSRAARAICQRHAFRAADAAVADELIDIFRAVY